jgi:hypothetical protein
MTRLGKKQKRMLQKAVHGNIKPQLYEELVITEKLVARGYLRAAGESPSDLEITDAGRAALERAP